MQWSYNDLGFGLWWVVMKEPPCQLYSLLSSDHVMPCKPLENLLKREPSLNLHKISSSNRPNGWILFLTPVVRLCALCALCALCSLSLSLSQIFFLSSIDSRCPRLKRTSARYNRTSLRSWGCLFARRTLGTNMPDILRHFRYCVWTFLWFCYTLVLLIKLFWRKGWVLNSLFMPSKQELVRVACEACDGFVSCPTFCSIAEPIWGCCTNVRSIAAVLTDVRKTGWYIPTVKSTQISQDLWWRLLKL